MRANGLIAALSIVLCASLAAPSTVLGSTAIPMNERISAEGLLVRDSHLSPNGQTRLEIEHGSAVDDPLHDFTATVRSIDTDGRTHDFGPVRGHAFFATNDGRLVAVEDAPSGARVRILDRSGQLRFDRELRSLTDPRLSADSERFLFRARDTVVSLELDSFSTTRLSPGFLFATGPEGRTAIADPDEVRVHDAMGRVIQSFQLPRLPQRIAFAPVGTSILVADAAEVAAMEEHSGARHVLFEVPSRFELRDLQVQGNEIRLGLRHVIEDVTRGELVTLDPDGRVLRWEQGPSRQQPRIRSAAPPSGESLGRHASIPWPLAPDSQQPVGNSYAEFQKYGSTAYMHPGIDVMGADDQPVYAVAGGQVKAILTTSAQYHWRVAIADEAVATTVEGFLYAHLIEETIAVNTGDTVVTGQYLGDLVDWPTAGFTHVHFARIEDTGTVWNGSWLCTENPHLDLSSSENTPPFFEPAVGNDLFAFPENETSTYQSPNALTGTVDIIAHVGDRISSSWVCSVQEIRYTIYPVVAPQTRIVDDKLAVRFDMALDTYQGGPIDPFLVDLLYKEDSTCDSDGDYNDREFFHIITNSNGDEIYEASDQLEAWDTSLLPDADYVIEVTAVDAAGNSATASMTVTTVNGNPTAVPAHWAHDLALQLFPNPSRTGSTLTFSLATGDRVTATVFDAAGRLVRTILSDSQLPLGQHALSWDATDSERRRVGSGIYFVTLETSRARRVEKLVLTR